MDYPRPTQAVNSGADLAGEMAAALAAASIVFRDDEAYSKKLVKGAATVYAFARDGGRRRAYSSGNDYIQPYYNSSGYYDEYIWGATWLYYATGNSSYITLATEPGFSKHSKALLGIPDLSVLSWDNKLPAAMLLLTRYRIFLNPGYPYEEMLRMYHNTTELNMCSYFQQFNVFNWTKGTYIRSCSLTMWLSDTICFNGSRASNFNWIVFLFLVVFLMSFQNFAGGMIQLNHGRPQPLQYVANAAFLASLYVDYLNATRVPGFNCGPQFISLDVLRNFATSQVAFSSESFCFRIE